MLSICILFYIKKHPETEPDSNFFAPEYIKKYPDIEKFYIIKEDRDNSEYIYDIKSLCELKGTRLHKKRNLISQFKRLYPDFKVHRLEGEYRHKALELTRNLMKKWENHSITLDYELSAMQISFDYFDKLGLHGIAVSVNNRLAAFSVFSALNPSTCDIQFEKSDTYFKGASQLINLETAKYLRPKHQYLNREQDLGIPGLRRAKISYEPLHLLTPYNFIFNQS